MGSEHSEAWGVAGGYQDIGGRWVTPPAGAVERVLETMGAGPGGPPASPILVLRQGERAPLEPPGEIVTEAGTVLAATAEVPADLPLGYHRLRQGDRELDLAVAPARCFLPRDLSGWGWALQLYAVRSAASWGIGDLADLRRVGSWSRELGAAFLQVNPLDAALPGHPQEPSPYFPTSRGFLNPLYLRVEEVPGAVALGARLEPLARAGRALNRTRTIDRDRVYDLKRAALEELHDRFAGDPAFDRHVEAEGRSLLDFATYCAIVEVHGGRWSSWPSSLRRADSAEVAEFRSARAGRVRFHMWLQWLLDGQLGAAATPLPLINDLPVGVTPDGADTWIWRDAFAAGVTVGAPPDPFNAGGQQWGLAPFDPWRLRAAGYRPFIEILRRAFRHAAGLRIDHVMSLFRLYWIPAGEGPDAGLYVRYPSRDLLHLLALESVRAGAFVIGEDLGTVGAGVRAELAARDVLSTRLLWFERGTPAAYPADAMAALTTHDLPTFAGVWSGADPDPAVRARIVVAGRLRGDEDPAAALEAAYRALAAAPSRLLAATLDDALQVTERPNRPGTMTGWPNWCLALPRPLEDITGDPGPAAVAQALRRPEGARRVAPKLS